MLEMLGWAALFILQGFAAGYCLGQIHGRQSRRELLATMRTAATKKPMTTLLNMLANSTAEEKPK